MNWTQPKYQVGLGPVRQCATPIGNFKIIELSDTHFVWNCDTDWVDQNDHWKGCYGRQVKSVEEAIKACEQHLKERQQ